MQAIAYKSTKYIILMKKMISDSIKYIGVDDLDIDLFESQYVVPEGMSYTCNMRHNRT